MKTEDIIGQFVILNENFIAKAHEVDENVPIKSGRPYLVVEIDGKSKHRLFAVPVQTNVSKSFDHHFFEKLPRNLDTFSNCDRGLLLGQMVPISLNQIAGKKGADTRIPRDNQKRDIILKNLFFGNGDNLPEKARLSFKYLQKQVRGYGMSAFQDKKFQQSYKIVSNAIFEETIKIKDEKLELIKSKVKNYLENHYMPFLREKVYQKHKNCSVTMPTRFTKINMLVKFLSQYEANTAGEN